MRGWGRGLKNVFGLKAASPLRRAALVGLVLAVIAVHGCVTRQVAERMSDFGAAPMLPPPRIEVVYVREMALSAPPVAAPAPQPTRRAPRPRAPRPASAPQAAVVAEAAVPEPVQEPASAPRPLPEPVPPPELAATTEQPAASAPEDAASAVAAASPGFDWPASTRVSYTLTGNYRGAVEGAAQVEWARAGTHYQVHLELSIGPPFSPLITRRMSSDGEITDQGLAPRRYDEDTEVIFRDRRRIAILFEEGGVLLPDGRRVESLPGVQDTASQFVQLTWLFTTQPELLHPGRTIAMPLALARHVDRWIYDVLGEDTLATPFGPLPAVHLKPWRASQKAGDLSAEIWFSPQLRYLPVRIRIEQDAETFIDLMIARKPELAGP